ncbi:hypothetical protein B9Z47_13600 [Limnohabitans sp. 2KL-1]|uniref:hypothetical protein n=1 Tax=Limnohabitans sp. 2KL-1 TaxID=1100699 RepID=UPI000D3A7824|nr:hypothetical protein [Limnohabitans sp. 2KL-1]PUE46385.1 hypothetical protein B9Z47_13600 [Limnohabitans sp. 2KL-1]
MNTFDEFHALTFLGDDRQFLIQVVKAMQDILNDQQHVMAEALAKDNVVRMRQCTHSHLPTLKIFGLLEAAKVFEMFEAAVSRQDLDAVVRLKLAVMAHWHDVQRVLSEWLTRQIPNELVIPIQQNDTMLFQATQNRFFPVDGP